MKWNILVLLFFSKLSYSNDLLTKTEQIGKLLFEDTNLSEPKGQSCSSCHIKSIGFANNDIVSFGANMQLVGKRNTPSISYSSFSLPFKYDMVEGLIVPVGGQFLDGRVNTLEEQVFGPLLNPLEMANESVSQVIKKIKSAPYWQDIKKHFKINNSTSDSKIAKTIVEIIVAYEKSSEFAQFSSKYDLWLAGKVQLSFIESKGFRLFERADKGNCAACHTLKKKNKDDKPLLTDFTYDNIGVPANPNNPYYKIPTRYNPQGNKYIDYGLGKSSRMKNGKYLGMFKVPTLRNIELTAPYMHNGVFKTLREVVEFYNSRDLKSKWGKSEVPYNINHTELGDLKLTEFDIDALVAFMLTLTDGYKYEK